MSKHCKIPTVPPVGAQDEAHSDRADLPGAIAASPWAFATVALYALLWLLFDPGLFNWHGIAMLATWCVTLFIQRGEHRDTQAIHAKLDETPQSLATRKRQARADR
jgi:low affinity Fe/Cu permease